MNIRKLFLLAVIPMLYLTTHAQQKDYTPQKGDFTLAATVGYNSFTQVTALSGYLTEYEATALSTDWTTKKMMIGIEGGWFVKDHLKLTVGGGLSFTTNPGYTGVPGTVDGESEPGDGSLPAYKAVAGANTMNYSAFVGVDNYFRIGVTNLMPYVGIRAGFAYSSNEQKWDDEVTLGKSMAEAYNIRGAFTFGADYFVLPAIYLGIQVDPLSYTYHVISYKPQEGLGCLSADSHNFSLLSAPTIKIGFKF